MIRPPKLDQCAATGCPYDTHTRETGSTRATEGSPCPLINDCRTVSWRGGSSAHDKKDQSKGTGRGLRIQVIIPRRKRPGEGSLVAQTPHLCMQLHDPTWDEASTRINDKSHSPSA